MVRRHMETKARFVNGSDYYRKAGLKPLIVHVSKKAHQALSSMAKQERRSLQMVAQAILEQASRDTNRTVGTVNAFVKGPKRT
jgi:hypothetical protein